jgi:hypothetical protein
MSFIHKTKAIREGGFASRLEKAVYDLLLLRERAREIKNIKQQQTISLTRANINVRIDFTFEDAITGEDVCCEAKGIVSDKWAIVKKLWPYYGPCKLEIWVGNYARPKLQEIVELKPDKIRGMKYDCIFIDEPCAR